MNRESRQTYRVALRPSDRLLISVYPDNGLPLLGDVVDINIHGANANFSVKPPPLPLSEVVRVRLGTRGSHHQVETEALIVSRSDENRVRCYELEFTDPASLERGLNARMFALFNRRGQVRIPMTDTPAAVRAEGGGGSSKTHRVQVHDISAGGLALLVPSDVAHELRSVMELQVRFRLPDEERPLQVVGRIRARRASRDGVIFGVQMISHRIRKFPQLQERIVAFLRQRELELVAGQAEAPDVEPGEAA